MERKTWQYVVIVLCAAVMFGNRFLPEVSWLNPTGVSTLCIFIASMVLLILIDVTWPLLMCIAAYTLAGVYPVTTAIAKSFGHHLFTFVVLNTILMAVLRDTGVLNRIAVLLISRPFSRKSAWHFILGLFLGEMVLGYFMSCTALMALFLGLTEQIYRTLDIRPGSRLATTILMGELVVCAVSYGASPIGHALAIMSIGMFEGLQTINYIQYLVVGAVVMVLALGFYLFLMRFVFRTDVSVIEQFDVDSLTKDMKPMSREEKISLAVFLCIVAVWLAPGLVQNTLPGVYAVLNSLGSTFPVMIGVLVLCLVTVDKKPILDYRTRVRNDAAWNAAYPIGMAMLNSAALTNPDAGITDSLATLLGPALSRLPGIVFVIIICFACTLIATVSSPTVGLMLTGSVAFTLIGSGVITGVNAGTMTVLLTICASLVLATPCSTYGALVYASGWTDKKLHVQYGAALSLLICAVTCTLAFAMAKVMIP